MPEGNRKDPRARVLNMTVRYKSATVDEFIENHSHDISRGGIFIKTRSPFPAGTLLKFEVRIAEDKKLMHGVGRVVWRREAERAEEEQPPGMGIKFIKTGEGATNLIDQLVAARQGQESAYEAGVRAAGGEQAADEGRESDPNDAITAEPPPAGAAAAAVDAEIQVSSPPKKRPDQAPEKRKVVLKEAEVVAQTPPPKTAATSKQPSQRPVSGPPEARALREREQAAAGRAPGQTERRPGAGAEPRAAGGPGFGTLIVGVALIAIVVAVVQRGGDEAADAGDTAHPPPVTRETSETALPQQLPPVGEPESKPSATPTRPADPTTAGSPPPGSGETVSATDSKASRAASAAAKAPAPPKEPRKPAKPQAKPRVKKPATAEKAAPPSAPPRPAAPRARVTPAAPAASSAPVKAVAKPTPSKPTPSKPAPAKPTPATPPPAAAAPPAPVTKPAAPAPPADDDNPY